LSNFLSKHGGFVDALIKKVPAALEGGGRYFRYFARKEDAKQICRGCVNFIQCILFACIGGKYMAAAVKNFGTAA